MPKLIIVTGRPGAGKSTLAKWLSKELQIPSVSKDNVREVLFDRLGWEDRKWAQILGRASIDIMFYVAERQLEVGKSLILDNAFDPKLSEGKLEALRTKYLVEIVQIVCNADADTLFRRFEERSISGNRHPGHGDEVVLTEMKTNLARDQSPVMEIKSKIIEIDTTDFSKIEYQKILSQVRVTVGE